MSSSTKVFRNSLVYAISSVISGGIVFIMMPIYTRVLSTAEYGVYSLVTSLSTLLVVPLVLGLDNAIGKFYFDMDQNSLQKFNGTLVVFILGLCVLGGTIYVLLGDFISTYLASGIAFYPYVLLGIGIAMLKPMYTIFQSMLQIRQKAVYYLINSVTFLLCNVICNVIFLFVFKLGVISLLLGMFASTAVFFVISLFEMSRRKFIVFSFKKDYLRKGMKYSLPLVPGVLLSTVVVYFVKFAIEKYLGIANVGIYDVALQFGLIVGVAQLAANRALFPFAFECFKKGDKKPVVNITNVLMVGYILICSAIAMFSKEIIFIFSGAEFQSAWLILPVIAIAYCIKALNYCYDNNILYQINGPKFLFINSIVSNVIFAAVTFLLISKFGLFAPALGILVSNLYSTIFAGIVARKINPVKYGEARIVFQFLIAIGIIFASLIGNYFFELAAFNWLSLLIKFVCSLSLVGLLLFMNRKYIALFKSFLNNRKKKKEESEIEENSEDK